MAEEQITEGPEASEEPQNTHLPKQFNHKEAEGRIWALWEKEDIFSAKVDPSKPAFCVVIPPPNVTGILHMGHVLDNTPQDIMTRWHRMRGFSAVWIPGTDHAGIATQNVVKKQLDKEGIDMRKLGREEFLKRVWTWKEKHGSLIINQLKRLGCSCDWKRERFTMDQNLSKAVLNAFVTYFKKGLIYKGKRMINWCTVCSTALANDEVEHEDHSSHLWHFKYPILNADGSQSADFVIVATTRPETMLGDTAVAVNPKDERYQHLHGRKVLLPLQNRSIPVIADAFVDPAFGTGVVKVTPAHDPNDYQMGLTHNLSVEVVIGEDGRMTASAGSKYAGKDRFACRKEVVQDLEALGLVEKIEKYRHSVGQCYRCNSVIEPLISDQWFVKMRPLAEKAAKAAMDGRIEIIPDSEKHDYFHWMENIQDWCISRQLWWGHRIPVYYCDKCGHQMCELEPPRKCDKCNATELRQDEDVLDTWFSSQLWPYSTLGWPEKTPELAYWYPNTWLMSGRDILFFWDARMIMSGLELMGDVPFRKLALHGLVRDEKGRKLSKSLGNSPDPLNLFDQYGADAVRAAISLRYPMGRQDTKLTQDFYKGGQNLVTKLWNASRLLQMNTSGALEFDSSAIGKTRLEDRWILSRLGETIRKHDECLEKSDFVHAFEAVSGFFWNEFCDWYLEIIKPRFKAEGADRTEALSVALHCERTLLKLMHPYIPYVTEDIWQSWLETGVKDKFAKGKETTIALSAWPEVSEFANDAEALNRMNTMMSIVRGVRDVRHNLNIAPKLELAAKVSFLEERSATEFFSYSVLAKSLAFTGDFEVYKEASRPAGHVPFKFDGGVCFVALPPDVNAADIKKRIESKVEKLEKALAGVKQRLSTPSFLESAPEELIRDNQKNEKEYSESIAKLRDFYESIG